VIAPQTYTYWGVALAIGLESMGVPLPGETALVAAALYAGKTHALNIWVLIAFASAGAIVGDNIGYWIGREVGFRVLLRHGSYVGLTESRIKLGEYLFQHHGGKIVFFGRFIALLRSLAALMAGLNQMSWPRFVIFNAAGGFLWAACYGLAAFYFGKSIEAFTRPVGLALLLLGAVLLLLLLWFIRRHEADLVMRAERAFPGPVKSRRRRLRSQTRSVATWRDASRGTYMTNTQTRLGSTPATT
jgi:membrane protein DedA with SNARE-associated domain